MTGASVELSFHGGTVRLAGMEPGGEGGPPAYCKWDEREHVHRVQAMDYPRLVLHLRKAEVPYVDGARAYATLSLAPLVQHAPFPYQREAIDAWEKNRSRGVIVLPTGAGKTYVATMAILARQRSTLVVVPTLDLLGQWYDVLTAAFGVPGPKSPSAGPSGGPLSRVQVGLVGGGYYDLQDLTITTYDSAYIHMERFGNRFGLVIFDEAHHLPSAAYAQAARMCIAPYRLGLTATPERTDDKTNDETIGPIVFRKDITELSGEYLAEYDVVKLDVPLDEEERAAYEAERSVYLDYLRSNGIRMSQKDGFARFLLLSSQSDVGRRALLAYRKQRSLALAAPGKLKELSRLLHTHRNDRAIVFTEDNATVYRISRQLLIPAITHQTKVKERAVILKSLSEGEYFAVVTSKVLNEGVNVPEANVAIVLSGSGSVREHVQRLGRVLRKREGKRAVLYELVAAGTSEERTSDKRREHVAYR